MFPKATTLETTFRFLVERPFDSTLQNLARMGVDGVCKAMSNPEDVEALRNMQGIIIDEAMMTDMETMTSFLVLMQAVPLKPSLRRKNALKLFGYRDVVAAGDTRQLPPANGRRPWWSGSIFRNMFEIFVLRNDRRHERDLAMQTLKEKFAWGGIVSGP